MGTYGSVSNHGIVSTSRKFTQIGPMTTTAADAAMVLSAIAGTDRYDPSTPDAGIAPSLSSGHLPPTPGAKPLAGRRIGVLVDYGAELTAPIGDRFDAFVTDLIELGAHLVDVEAPLPCPPDLFPSPELVAFHRDLYPERGHLYSSYQRELVAEALAKAGSVSAVDSLDAEVARTAYSWSWADRIRRSTLDVIVSPSQTQETPERGLGPDDHDDLLRFGNTEIRRMWNVAGFPAITVPTGLTPTHGMPVGAQFAGLAWAEHIVLQVAIDYQQHTSHHRLRPPVGPD
jgi:Asp-tRNA(Asn)/Glu-tRNA(Gln) amidotransferase A subunit family amidase